jgi:hypothetical protein
VKYFFKAVNPITSRPAVEAKRHKHEKTGNNIRDVVICGVQEVEK